MIIVAFCISLMVLTVIKYILHVQKIDNCLKNVRTLPRIPMIGNVMLFMGKSFQVLCEEFYDIILRNGKILKMQIGPTFYVILNEPEDLRTVLLSKHCLDRPYIYDFLHRPQSILAQRTGSAWKPIRKLMNPMFNSKTLQSFFPILNEKASILVQKLEKEVNGPHFDLMHYSSICTLDSVCSTIMGIDLNAQPNKGMDFLSSLEGIYEALAIRFATLWAHFEFIYRLTNVWRSEQKCLSNVREYTNYIIDVKTNIFLSTNNNNASLDDCEDKRQKSDFPLIPLYVEGQVSEELMKQQIDILLVAGHETTASTISYAILMLAMHPNVQEQVYEELHLNYESQRQQTNYEIMQKCELLDRVIKETMRLFPVVFAFLRTPTHDIPLKSCVIPKGVTIAVPIYTLHRRPDIWGDDAEQFNPNHFLPEKVRDRHPFAYLPFSGGSRNCIGYQYAMLTMKVMLSTVLRQYKFSTDLVMKELRPKFEVTLRLTNKHMVRVQRRDW